MNSRLKGALFFFVTICYLSLPIIEFHAGETRSVRQDSRVTHDAPSGGFALHADEKGKTVKPRETGKEMKDPGKPQEQDESGMLIKVMGVVLAVWLGIALFLVRINLKIVKLEKEINDL